MFGVVPYNSCRVSLLCFYTTDLFICASELHVTRSLNKLRLTYHSPLDSVRGVVGVLPPAAADANVLGGAMFFEEGKLGGEAREMMIAMTVAT